MNTYNVSDDAFLNSEMYKRFITENPSTGSLKVRAYAASQAIPIKGLEIVVRTIFENNNIIFFEGKTNASGVIDAIDLPAPNLDPDNLDVPAKRTYEILATYTPDNASAIYRVNIYEDVCVVQNISVVPDMNLNVGDL